MLWCAFGVISVIKCCLSCPCRRFTKCQLKSRRPRRGQCVCPSMCTSSGLLLQFAFGPTALCTKILKIQWNCMNEWKCFPLEVCIIDQRDFRISSVNSKHTNSKHRQPEGWLASQWGWLNAQCGCSAAPFPDRHKSHCQRGMSGQGGCLWSCLCLSLEKWGWKVTNPKEKCGAGSRFSSH